MGARHHKPDTAPPRPCGHPPPPQLQPRSAPSAQPLAPPDSHPSPAAPGRLACPAPLPAPRPPAVSSSGAPAPGPPRLPSSFSAVCPVKTLPGSRVLTTANPPLVTSSPAASAAGARLLWQRPARPGALAGGPGFPSKCRWSARVRGMAAACGRRSLGGPRGAGRSGRALLLLAL